MSLLTGVGFGVGPAWMASGADPADTLRGTGGVIRDASARPQRALMVLQIAISLVLLTMAGLLTQSLSRARHQSYGVEQQGRLIVRIDPQSAGYTSDRLTGLYDRLQDRLRHTPGVLSESLSLYTAVQGDNWSESVFIEGRGRAGESSWDRVSADYFDTIGTPIVRGRGFTARDTATSRRVAVVNEAFVSRFFPDEDPLGRHFGKKGIARAGDYEIVGVAGDAIYRSAVRAVAPMFFVPLSQKVAYDTAAANRVEDASMYMGSIELHVQGDAEAMAPTIRRVLAQVDPDLTPISIFSFGGLVGIQTSEQRLIARISSGFGLMALLLAIVGLYGVTSYRVAGGRGRSGCGWRSAPAAATSGRSCCAARSRTSGSGSRLACHWPFSRRRPCGASSTTCRRSIR